MTWHIALAIASWEFGKWLSRRMHLSARVESLFGRPLRLVEVSDHVTTGLLVRRWKVRHYRIDKPFATDEIYGYSSKDA